MSVNLILLWGILIHAVGSTPWCAFNLDTAMHSCRPCAQLLGLGYENLGAANSKPVTDWLIWWWFGHVQMLRNCIWFWWLFGQANVKKLYMQWTCRNCALHRLVTGVTKVAFLFMLCFMVLSHACWCSASPWYNYWLTGHRTPSSSYSLTQHVACGVCRCVTVSWCLP